jgi:hypothetical protein
MLKTGQDEPTAACPLQFTLRGMFLITTWAACTAALAAWRGAGVVVLTFGLGISALSCQGVLAPWQAPERRSRFLMRIGWLLLLSSLALPSVRGCSNSSVSGLGAAYHCAAAQFSLVDESIEHRWLAYLHLTMLNLANLLMALSPLCARGTRPDRWGATYTMVLGPCAVAVWSLPVGDARAFLAGYYLWALASAVILSSFRLSLPTFIAMVLLSILRLCLATAL